MGGGVYLALTRLSLGNLSHDAVLTCREAASEDNTSCSDALKYAFRQVGTVRRLAKNEEIGAVLVFGEQTSDSFMATALCQFL